MAGAEEKKRGAQADVKGHLYRERGEGRKGNRI